MRRTHTHSARSMNRIYTKGFVNQAAMASGRLHYWGVYIGTQRDILRHASYIGVIALDDPSSLPEFTRSFLQMGNSAR